jgi:hypothetical protein
VSNTTLTYHPANPSLPGRQEQADWCRDVARRLRGKESDARRDAEIYRGTPSDSSSLMARLCDETAERCASEAATWESDAAIWELRRVDFLARSVWP